MSLNSKSIDFLDLPNGIKNVLGKITQGIGFCPTYQETITTVQTTAQTAIVGITPTKTTGRYRVGGNIMLNSGTNTGTVGFAINYVDAAGTTHTADVPALIKADGTIVGTGTAASTDWKMVEFEIAVDNSGTPITIDTLVTGSVHYIATAYIQQVA